MATDEDYLQSILTTLQQMQREQFSAESHIRLAEILRAVDIELADALCNAQDASAVL